MIRRRSVRIATLCGALSLVACGGGTAPIVHKTPGVRAASNRGPSSHPLPGTASTYRVRGGDTLQEIAFRYRLDVRDLARWNRISDPDRIFVGQVLSLVPSKSSAGKTAAGAPKNDRTVPRAAPARTTPAGEITWQWPTRGDARRAVASSGSVGLDIRGHRGQPVRAAAPGKVVYSGSGLRGYGQLIIVKHNEDFLSAYAHNDRLLVEEGASVAAGQKIALMGDSDAKEVMLHFEIRRQGKAVEPLNYLPKQ